MVKDVSRRNWALIAAVALVSAYFMIATFGPGYPGMFSGPSMFIVFVIFAATWVVPVLLVVWIVSALTRGKGTSRVAALHIAEERYARGEIDRQQFEEIRDVLAQR